MRSRLFILLALQIIVAHAFAGAEAGGSYHPYQPLTTIELSCHDQFDAISVTGYLNIRYVRMGNHYVEGGQMTMHLRNSSAPVLEDVKGGDYQDDNSFQFSAVGPTAADNANFAINFYGESQITFGDGTQVPVSCSLIHSPRPR